MVDISLTVVLMPIQDFVISDGTLSSAALLNRFIMLIFFFFLNKLIAKHTDTLITSLTKLTHTLMLILLMMYASKHLCLVRLC